MGRFDRFTKIEPKRDEPAEEPHDPFAPPPQRELVLEVADDPSPARERHLAERRARAEADLATSQEPPPPLEIVDLAGRHNFLQRMTVRERAFTLLGAVAVIGLVGEFVTPIVWGIFPIVLVLVVVTAFVRD